MASCLAPRAQAAAAPPTFGPDTALLVVDMQRDFMDADNQHSEGPVPVAGARARVPLVTQLMAAAVAAGAAVAASRDWHPPDHISFVSSHPGSSKRPGDAVQVVVGGKPLMVSLFRPHCVAGTAGAEFAEGLDLPLAAHTVHKGTQAGVESFSAFYDMARSSSAGLADWLQAHGVRTLFVCGVATEYCVRATVLDSLAEGFATVLLTDAVAGADRDAAEAALTEMQQAGAALLPGLELLARAGAPCTPQAGSSRGAVEASGHPAAMAGGMQAAGAQSAG